MSRAMSELERYEHGVGPVPHQYLIPAPPVLWVPLRVPVPGECVATRDLDDYDPE